ncbi:unnamed protein product [Nezara viridula]|uniref:Uncharacterized protein n=1 Tax=Nezara viridula TaxID=85310 RepID=A0A9P0H654_NEZVI|nr:unnamed protein product [Nezara viridula]
MSSFRAKRWKKKYAPGGGKGKDKDSADGGPKEAQTVPANNWEFHAFSSSLFGGKRDSLLSEDEESHTPSPPASRPGSRPPSWLAALPHHFVIEEEEDKSQGKRSYQGQEVRRGGRVDFIYSLSLVVRTSG